MIGFNASALLAEPTTVTPTQWVTDAYMGIYHHAPDPAGLTYWAGVVRDQSRQAVIDSFLSAPEFCLQNPTDTTCLPVTAKTGEQKPPAKTDEGTIIPGVPDMYVYIGAAALALVVVMGMKKG